MVISTTEVAILDTNSEFYGVPPEVLMENAGRGAAGLIGTHYPEAKKILIVCGTGNNGGDGFVCARHLSEDGADVTVLLLGAGMADIKTTIARNNFVRLDGVNVLTWPRPEPDQLEALLSEQDLIVDAMLGAGLSGRLREPYRSVVESINGSGRPVVSIDMPTGLGTDVQIRPEMTITFHDTKEGMDRSNCGKIEIVDIGIPREAQVLVGRGDLQLYPGILKKSSMGDSHKGDRGRLFVVGGGPYTGAPALAGMAALRTGADLVFIHAPESAAGVIATYSPNYIVRPASDGDVFGPEDVRALVDSAREYRATAVLLGNGLGRSEPQRKFVNRAIIDIRDIPLCLDADALTQIDHVTFDFIKKRRVLITPHIREYNEFVAGYDESLQVTSSELYGIDEKLVYGEESDALDRIMRCASELGITILLKGPTDIITDGKRVKVNKTGNIGMTGGGTGDVLAGVCAALLSMGLSEYDAGRLGAYITGYAGDIVWDHRKYGLLATDIIDAIPRIFFEYNR